jgi:DNA-binding MarR family transcriptional regulator
MPADRDRTRSRRRAAATVKAHLRDLRLELAAVNHLVGVRIDLKDSDLDALDVITRHGPLSPTSLARRMGVHVATLTGILNRLEAGGWVTRGPAPNDRRGSVISSVAGRQAEVFRQYDGMNSALDRVLVAYSDEQLETIADFLERCTEAGRTAADDLVDGS